MRAVRPRESGDVTVEGAFDRVRPRLSSLAYRMTGSVSDAEDAVQDAWLRWRRVDHATVSDPEAYLVRMVTRLALDRLTSAQRRREAYIGPYLPEPIVRSIDRDDDPEASAELADSLTFAFLVLLDELTPIERAVFILHDVFAYSFVEISAAVDRSPEACRQIASRTRRRLEVHRDDAVRGATRDQERRTLDALVVATLTGDVTALMTLLAPDVVQLDDGGAARRAARHPIVGPDRVARFMMNLAQRMFADPAYTADIAEVNGHLGIVVRYDAAPSLVFSFEYAADGRVRRIYAQLNPDKLHHVR